MKSSFGYFKLSSEVIRLAGRCCWSIGEWLTVTNFFDLGRD